MTRLAHLLRIPVLLTTQGAMVVVLHRLGRVPALRIDLASPGRWLAATSPEDALAAVLRLVALGVAAWLLLSTAAFLLACLSGAPTLVRTTARVTLPAVRRAVERSVAAGLLAGTLSSPLPVVAQPAGPPPPPPDVAVPRPDRGLLPPGVAPPATARPGPTPVPASAEPSGGPTDHATGTHRRVEPGDNLWSIARRHLAEARGAEPDIAAVARYWRRVVEDNRATLRSGDPDLIHPGETVSLPPVSDHEG